MSKKEDKATLEDLYWATLRTSEKNLRGRYGI